MIEEKKKVIVIEDELCLAKVLKMQLESGGYEVEIAGDAYQGTQSIIRNRFDLIVLDLMMPAGGGYSLLERIRKLPMKSTIPVIIMTGKNLDESDKTAVHELDVKAVFPKPYDTAKFIDMVHSLAPIYN